MSWSIGEWGTRRGQLEQIRGPGQARLPGVGTLLGRQPEWREQSWRRSGLGPWGFSGFLQGRTKKRVRKESASLTAAAVPPGSWGLAMCVLTVVEQKPPGPPPKPGRFPATALLGAVCNPRRVEPCKGPEGPSLGVLGGLELMGVSRSGWHALGGRGEGSWGGVQGGCPGQSCASLQGRQEAAPGGCVCGCVALPLPHSWAHLSPPRGGAVLVLALSHCRGGMGVCRVHIFHQALRGWQWS